MLVPGCGEGRYAWPASSDQHNVRPALLLICYYIKVEESPPFHTSLHSPTFFMHAVSQILGHRILEECSSFLTLKSASPKFGTPNWEAIG